VRVKISSGSNVFKSNLFSTVDGLSISGVTTLTMWWLEFEPIIVVFSTETSHLLLSRTIWIVLPVTVQSMAGAAVLKSHFVAKVDLLSSMMMMLLLLLLVLTVGHVAHAHGHTHHPVDQTSSGAHAGVNARGDWVLSLNVFNSKHVVVITLGESGDFELIDETVLDVVGVKGTVGATVNHSKVFTFVEISSALHAPVVIAITLLVFLVASDFVLVPILS